MSGSALRIESIVDTYANASQLFQVITHDLVQALAHAVRRLQGMLRDLFIDGKSGVHVVPCANS